jgi:hypothetical protein
MNAVDSRSWGKNWSLAVVVIFFVFSLLGGLLIGAGQLVLLAGFVIVVLSALLSLLFLGQRVEDRRGFLLVGVWWGMLLVHGLQQSSGLPVGYILELVLFGLVLASVQCVWDLSRQDWVLRLLLALLLLHFGMALLSSMLGRSQTFAALWQLQYNLKWPLMLGLGTLLIWNGRVDDLMRKIIAWSWIFIVPILAVEIATPEIHSYVFGENSDKSVNPVIGVGARYRGPFNHSGYLAIICALLAAGAMATFLVDRGRRWGLLILLYAAIVLLSGQRQELLAMVFALFLLVAISWKQYLHLMVIFATLLGGLLVAGFIYFEYIPMRDTLAQWGMVDDLSRPSERAILSTNGIAVAHQFFPLGSGLGTYGGVGAQKFDLKLFWELGFGSYWWFLQGKFLVDTYWPNVIAESGFVGAFLLLVFFIVLWITLLRRAWCSVGTPVYGVSLLALAAMTLLMANTPSSPVLTDPRGAFIFWLIIGSAWRATMPIYSKSRLARTHGVSAGSANTSFGTAVGSR